MARQLRIHSRTFISLSALTLSLFHFGCSTVSYVAQAGKGQLMIMNRARPIAEVIEDHRTPPYLVRLLSEVEQVKSFGEENGLEKSNNYTEFVKLDTPYVVWVITACKPLSFECKRFSFPIVGSFNYLGWFDKEDAKEYRDELVAEGWDVDLRGATAFSTLGWFRDPILSSMIRKGDYAFGGLVNVVLHESVHATFYINGQSYFNESIAVFVADELTLEYLEDRLSDDSKEKLKYKEIEIWAEKRNQKFREIYYQMEKLYQSDASEESKLSQKKRALASLQTEYKFRREINNATLTQFRMYGVGIPDFKAVFDSCGKDWKRFWNQMKRLNEESFQKEHQSDLSPVLRPIVDRGCS